MTEEDTTASTLGTLATIGESSRLPLLPALTILAHPDVRRVGETAPLTALLDRRSGPVDRDEPLFFAAGAAAAVAGSSTERCPRRPTLSSSFSARTRRFEAASGRRQPSAGARFQAVRPARAVTQEELAAGLVITINKRVVLCLHRVHFPVARSRRSRPPRRQ